MAEIKAFSCSSQSVLFDWNDKVNYLVLVKTERRNWEDVSGCLTPSHICPEDVQLSNSAMCCYVCSAVGQVSLWVATGCAVCSSNKSHAMRSYGIKRLYYSPLG